MKLRVDGAKEWADEEFVDWLAVEGVELDIVPRYEHWKNGLVEHIFRTLQEQILAMLTAAQLSMTYWGKACLTGSFLYNLMVTAALPKDVTPHETFYQTKPNVSYLRVWGCR